MLLYKPVLMHSFFFFLLKKNSECVFKISLIIYMAVELQHVKQCIFFLPLTRSKLHQLKLALGRFFCFVLNFILLYNFIC